MTINKNMTRKKFTSDLYFFARCPEHDTIKPYALRYQPDDDLPRTNFVAEKREIEVRDVRDWQDDLDFDRCGFKIMPFQTSMHHDEYTDAKKIKEVYLPELRDRVQSALGAAHVYVLDYAVRSRSAAFPYSEGPQREDVAYQPIHMAHIGKCRSAFILPVANLVCVDMTVDEATRLINYLYGKDATQVLKAPWHIVTVWQPLRGPVRDWPIGVCDASSVAHDDDTLASDIVFPDHYTENVQVHYSPKHKWYYVSEQQPHEALLFKTVYDKVLGCPHGSFPIKSDRKECAPRESIDTRILVSFAKLDPFPFARDDGFCSLNHL
ncbi:hypothetical protein DM02DRAFT_603318 [Periconia macrospinosa]|uniref:Methyltransferase n=1 Tax=Periconia macrospinosa TaxID=97972 RepID=A0A2V1D782_9PLEO|nr:hypothetical protein DM02DRAFT_603318 [Periconia macrospinosa]